MFSQHYLKSCTTEKLIALRRDCCENIADHYMFVMGTLQNRMHCCKKEGCMCMRKTEPQLHGPYDYLAHRGGEKPGMLVLNNNQLRCAKKMVNNYDKLWKYLCKISSINAELLRRKQFGAVEKCKMGN